MPDDSTNVVIPEAYQKLRAEQITRLLAMGPLRKGAFRYHSFEEADAHFADFEDRRRAYYSTQAPTRSTRL